MRKLITVILILSLFLPAAVLAEDPDPIVGAWYIMLDYKDAPYDDPSMAGKNYMIYVMFFEPSGTISGFSGESVQNIGFYGAGSTIGTWVKSGDTYTTSIVGIGTSNPTIEDGRLIIFAAGKIHYSMRRLEWASWENDLISR